MVEQLLPMLRCPYTGAALELEGPELVTADGRRYPVVDGMPHLLDPEQVAAIDRSFQEQYTAAQARNYDRMLRLFSLFMGCWEPAERRRMVDLLDLSPGARVLEVSVGTGANLPLIARRLRDKGEIVALDLSVGDDGRGPGAGAGIAGAGALHPGRCLPPALCRQHL